MQRVTIRFVNGEEDFDIDIIERNVNLETKFIRLVYRGRIITDYIRVHTIIPVQPVDEASESESTKSDESAALLKDKTDAPSHPFYMHCVISDAPLSTHALSTDPQTVEAARGFDRLLEIGLSIEEVNTLRTQFHAIRGTNPQDQATEDNWIDTGNNAPLTQNEVVGGIRSQVDLLVGLCIGFFAGILAAASIKVPGIYNSRQRLGIVIGVCVNFTFGIMRYFYA